MGTPARIRTAMVGRIPCALMMLLVLATGSCTGGATGATSQSREPTAAGSPQPSPSIWLPAEDALVRALEVALAGAFEEPTFECDRDRSPRDRADGYIGCLARGRSTELPHHEGSVFVAALTPPEDLNLSGSTPAASWLHAPAPTIGEWLPVCNDWSDVTEAELNGTRLNAYFPSASQAVYCSAATRWRGHARLAVTSDQATVLAAVTIRIPPLQEFQRALDHTTTLVVEVAQQAHAEV